MAAVSSPTSLATFTSPHASSSKLPHVTLSPVKGSHGKLAVAAVQGDGVWTYDLKTLRPTTSFTVPPSTQFSTSPICYIPSPAGPASRTTGKDKQKAKEDAMDIEVDAGLDGSLSEDLARRVTIVGIQNGEGVKKGDEGRILWAWKGEDGSEKQILKLQFPVHSFHHLNSTTYPILILGSSKIALLDQSLAIKSVDLSTFRYVSDLLSAKIVSSTSVTSRLVTIDGKGHIKVIRLDHPEEGSSKGEVVTRGNLSGDKDFSLLSADISEDGTVNAISSDNHLYSRNIRELSSQSVTSWPRILHPCLTSPILALASHTNPIALIPTSHPSPSLLLAVTSPFLPAVLTSTTISAFASAGSFAALTLLAQPSNNVSTVGIVMSHRNADSTGGRSILYICEVTTPLAGVGMSMLLGSHDRTSVYLSTQLDSSEKSPKTDFDTSVEVLIANLKRSLKGAETAQAAEEIWSKWIEEEDLKASKVLETKGKSANLPESFVRQVISTIFEACLTRRTVGEPQSQEVKVSRTGVYASRIVRDLVARKVVNDSMWHGGVVAGGLLPCGDWETITLALSKLNTIPSSTLVKLIHTILHPQTEKSTNTTPAPRLSKFLLVLLSSTVPDTTYRIELRKGLSVEDATRILEVLVGWAEGCVEKRSEGLNGWSDIKNGEERSHGSSPSLEAIISHSSLILDSHLPLFLSHEPSHYLLARLQQTTEPLLLLQNQLRQLRAPVEAVLTLARREQKLAEEAEAKRVAMRSAIGGGGGGGKKKGKGGKEVEGRGMGREIIGKWKVEDFVF